ncbi:MAG: YbaN family protein [Pseudomonadota bacterium]
MRWLYLAAGIVSVAVGAAGVVLPLLPTVPFFLLAAYCFARSHPEWERRIVEHPSVGPQIVAWRERRAVSRKAKLGAIATLIAGVAFTYFTIGLPWVWFSVGALVIIGGWIVTRHE